MVEVLGELQWNLYFCQEIKNHSKMAILGNVCTPVLTGESARRFLEAKERVDRLPSVDLPEDFFDELERFLEKSRRFAAKLKQRTTSENVRKHEAGEFQSEGALR